jgi:hypothetical protein
VRVSSGRRRVDSGSQALVRHDDGYARPVSRMRLSQFTVELRTAVAMIVESEETVRFTGPNAQALLSRDMQRGIAAAQDAEFLAVILTGAPSHGSTGNALGDTAQLLEAVHGEGSAAAQLYWVMSPDVANMATVATVNSGSLLFPGMSPTGGVMLNLPALVCSVLPSGMLVLLDAAQISGTQQAYTFDSSNQAVVEMVDTSPSNNEITGTGASLVSMYQCNCSCLRAVSYFGVEKIGSHAVSIIDDIDWVPLQGS